MSELPSARVRVHVGSQAPAPLRSLYEAEFDRLVALATVVVGNRELGEELVQDTFAQLLRAERHTSMATDLRAYVRTALLNACRSRLRRLVLERRLERRSDRTEVVDTPPPVDHELRSAILELPLRQRQCVALRFYDDRSVAGIADVLGLSPGSVKTHLHRGLSTLRERLDDDTARTEPSR